MKVNRFLKALLCIFSLVSGEILADDVYNPYKFSRDSRYQDPQYMWEQWDSTYRKKGSFFSLRNAPSLEKILESQWSQSAQNNDLKGQIQAAIPLSVVYHHQAKFKAGLPILEFLYRHEKQIPGLYWKHVLIMLEEEYRGTNEIEKAIPIRRLRIQLGYIKTFWEIYKECGLFEDALRDYLQFQQVPARGDYGRLMYFQRLGWIYFDLKNYKKAYETYARGFKEVDEIRRLSKEVFLPRELNYWEGYFTGLMAQCKMEMGDYAGVIPMLQYDLRLSGDNPDTQIDVLILLARSYLHFKQPKLAKAQLDRSRQLISQKAVKMSRLNLLGVYAEYYSARKQYDSAFFYGKAYRQYLDTMNAHVNRNKSILLLGQLELAKHREESLKSKNQMMAFLEASKTKDFKIKLLSFMLGMIILGSLLIYINFRQKGQLNKNRIQLDLEHERNAVLLKELHHRVKNNLQVMYSLLNLQKRRTNNSESIDLIMAMQNRIQTIALIHNNLFQSDEMEYVSMESYFRTLIDHLHQIYNQEDLGKVGILYEIDSSLKMRYERIATLGLIVNEIATNAFKYAFSGMDKGVLWIGIRSLGEQVEVIIADNGSGQVSQIQEYSNLGMRLIRILSEQMGASHRLEQGEGVKHLLVFTLETT